jgi:indoleamine 2,3-dioxygenase
LLFPAEPDNLDLSNLATLQTFTGSMDESWFYLISVAIEAAAGPLIGLMLDAMKAARAGRIHEVTDCLKAFAASLDDLGALLKRMYENCDSHVFYHRIRPYLAGSKNMKDAGLPDGVCFDIGYGTPVDREYVQFSGGSNAQSSVIQFFDLVLGIEHKATGEVPSLQETLGAPSDNFIHDMRQYMPGPHRRFLLHIAAVANIRDFVLATQTDVDLVVAYDACLAMLRRLRDNHIEMVTRYIIIPSRDARNKKSTAQDDSKKPANLATTNAKLGTSEKKNLKGTGGTALIPFLRQARDETGSPAVGEWARMLMSGTKKEKDAWGFARERTFRSLGEKNGGVEIKGLSGTWTDEDTGGGICHW